MKRLCWVLLLILLALPALARDKYLQAGPVQLNRDGEKWASKTLKKLSLEEKIGQLFMVWTRAEFLNVNSPRFREYVDLMRKYHLGGFAMTVWAEGPFLYRNQPYEAAMLANLLQKESKLPLLFAADFERGVSMRLYGTTVFPHAMAFGAAGKADLAEAFGRITAQEARAVGIHWNFFPVADVNSNPANPIINTRAFGGDPQQVGDLVAAYIRGARQTGLLTTAKHFPGHGDTDTDSHLAVARVGGDRNRIETVELPPFRRAVEAGVDSIMVAHVAMPALEPDANRVATISHNIINGLLKQQMGFKGLVVTDAMDMRGLTNLFPPTPGTNPAGRAAVETIKAGNDMLLIPSDLDGSYRGLLEAVRSGEVPESRIDESVFKILRMKASVGLHKARLVDVEALPRVVGDPANVAVGQQVAEAAITLVRDNGQVLPLRGTAGAANAYGNQGRPKGRLVAVIFSDDQRTEAGRMFERQLRNRVPDVEVYYIDQRTADGMSAEVIRAAEQARAVVAAMYVIPTAWKTVTVNGQAQNTVALVGGPAGVMQRILQRAAPKTVLIALGSPYLGADFPQAQTYICAFSNVEVSETAAVKALFGEVAIAGRLPVEIPGIAQRGSGISRAPQVQQGGQQGNAPGKANP
jgi:beta-N-acetylhexosaminidase